MEELLDKLSAVLEAGLDAQSKEEQVEIFSTSTLQFMVQTNSVLQNNLENWTLERVQVYGQRISNYGNINSALRALKDKTIDNRLLDLATVNSIDLFDSIISEYQPKLEISDDSEKRRIIEEIILPHYMLINFLRKQRNDNSESGQLSLSNLDFVSTEHTRVENGSRKRNNAKRTIKIESNPQIRDSYLVTIYNNEGQHPFWGDNVQMAPKRMKIKSQTDQKIELIGFGVDDMGGSFADYGLTILSNSSQVNKLILHLIDRKIDIEYVR